MKSIEYTFSSYYEGSSYIFQSIKKRKLTNIYHSHDFFELIIFLKGNGKQYINGKEYLTHKDTVVLLKPGDSHCFLSQSEDIFLISLSIEYSEALRFFKVFNLERAILASKELIMFKVNNISTKINFASWSSSKSPHDYELKYLFCSSIKFYLDYLNQNSDVSANLLNAIDKMKELQNLQTGIPAFVEFSNYSRSHLTKLIRKYYNISLQEFIMDMRLQTAYNSIILSSDCLEDIACSVGYSSFSHFNKIFKEKYGISPARLRKTKNLLTI